MIKLTADEKNRVLVCEAEGTITADDIYASMDDLQERFPALAVRVMGGKGEGISLLLDWENLEGWQMGAKTAGTVSGMGMSDVITRVAIVAEEKWHGEKERIADIGKNAEVKVFPLGQREEALRWLSRR